VTPEPVSAALRLDLMKPQIIDWNDPVQLQRTDLRMPEDGFKKREGSSLSRSSVDR
jgi:hypothetical protein